jgi:hypothetical protein
MGVSVGACQKFHAKRLSYEGSLQGGARCLLAAA